MTPLGAGFWPFVRIIYFAFSRFLSVKKPSSAWSCPTSKNFKILEKFEHRPFTWYVVLWGLNVYLDLWKQKYSSQKFSKKYKNPYFCPTLELVKITLIRGQICCPKHVHKLFREVFSSGFSFTKKKYKMYKKKTSTKTMILFVEIIYFYKKKIQNVELFCRSFVEFKNCRRFFSHFCRNKNVVLTLWVFISLTTWFV